MIGKVLGALLVFPLWISAQNAPPPSAATRTFDTPIQRKVVDLGPSRSNMPGVQSIRIKLSCYYFRNFMVKQYDTGEKGAEWRAIAPVTKTSQAACSDSHGLGENVIDGQEWSGYFKGAKENLVFFDADDGANGGLAFAIFDAKTGKKIFEDSAYESRMWNHKTGSGPFNHLRVDRAEDGSLRLRYLRVTETDCDLHREKAECWERVKTKLRLKRDCDAGVFRLQGHRGIGCIGGRISG